MGLRLMRRRGPHAALFAMGGDGSRGLMQVCRHLPGYGIKCRLAVARCPGFHVFCRHLPGYGVKCRLAVARCPGFNVFAGTCPDMGLSAGFCCQVPADPACRPARSGGLEFPVLALHYAAMATGA